MVVRVVVFPSEPLTVVRLPFGPPLLLPTSPLDRSTSCRAILLLGPVKVVQRSRVR